MLGKPGLFAEQETSALLATVGKAVEQAALPLGQGMDGGDAALGVQVGKRNIKPFQNGLGDHAQAGSLGFPVEAVLGVRLIDGPGQVVRTNQMGMGAEDQQRQDDHRRLPQGGADHCGGVGLPSGFEEHLPAVHQVAVRGMGCKPVPVQVLSPDGIVAMTVPQLNGQQPVRRRRLQTATGGVARTEVAELTELHV